MHEEHTHDHAMEGEHTHQHTHSHEHPHDRGHLHDGDSPHEHAHTPGEQLAALMKYMVGHNAAHTKEVADLASQLEQGNEKLAEALAELETK